MRQLVRRGALVVLAAGLWFGAADPARAADEPEHTVTKVVVSLTDHTELKLDLTKPEDWTLLTGFLKQGKVEHFVRTEIFPYERDKRWGTHGPSADLVAEMRQRARAATSGEKPRTS